VMTTLTIFFDSTDRSKKVWDDPGVVRIIPLVKGTETDGRDQPYSYYRQGGGML
jgi:hypothetical protein